MMPAMDVPPARRRKRSPASRLALDALGVALFGAGAVGVVTPGMPTTVFWIGTVVCFLKTRPGAVRPILRTPVIGPAIRGFLRWKPFGGGRKRAKRRP